MKYSVWILSVSLGLTAQVMAAPERYTPIPGRLFYSPAQRGMLGKARVNQVTEMPKTHAAAPTPQAPSPVSFDGILTRSDGVSTHWINGRAHVGRTSAEVRNLKPGQTRAERKVYESYQVLRPTPSVITLPPVPPRIKLAPQDSDPLP